MASRADSMERYRLFVRAIFRSLFRQVHRYYQQGGRASKWPPIET